MSLYNYTSQTGQRTTQTIHT